MGWIDYSIYGRDYTQTQHYDFITWSGAGNENEILDEGWLGDTKTKIPKERIIIFKKGIPKILKRMSKVKKYWNEDLAIEWQMLAALFLDNKIKLPLEIKKNGIDATEYLIQSEHTKEFDYPYKRRAKLRQFLKRLKKN